MKKNLSKLLVVLLSLVICEACAIKPPNKPVCVDLAPTRGWCTYTVSDDEFYIDEAHPFEGKKWPQVKSESLLVPASSWAAIKAFILKLCRKSGSCKQDQDVVEYSGKRLDYMLQKVQYHSR